MQTFFLQQTTKQTHGGLFIEDVCNTISAQLECLTMLRKGAMQHCKKEQKRDKIRKEKKLYTLNTFMIRKDSSLVIALILNLALHLKCKGVYFSCFNWHAGIKQKQ